MFLESGLGLAVSNKNQKTLHITRLILSSHLNFSETEVCHTIEWGSCLIGSSFFFLVIYKSAVLHSMTELVGNGNDVFNIRSLFLLPVKHPKTVWG